MRRASCMMLIWLFVAGAALVIATLVIFGSISSGKPGQTESGTEIKKTPKRWPRGKQVGPK